MKKNSWEIFPRKDYLTTSSQIPLVLRARINGKYFKYSLGITIPDEKYWDSKHSQIRRNPVFDPTEKNKILATNAAKANKIITDAQINNRLLDRNDFARQFLSTTSISGDSFFSYCENEIQHMKKTNFAKETIKSYNSYVTKLKQFRDQITFADLDKDFIRELDVFMVRLKNKENTRQKMFAFLNSMLNRAKTAGVISENVLQGNNPVKKKEGQRSFLTIEELKLLEEVKLESKKLKLVLDYFLFACYTGLRFTDLRNLRFSHLVKIDDQPHIRLLMHKTGDEVTIPLIKKAQSLIPGKGFDNQRVFKVKCNQVSNRDLKDLMIEAKINKQISMHCARHTFATVAMSLGIDIFVISKILGHKELKTTRIYAKLQDKRKIEEMRKWE